MCKRLIFLFVLAIALVCIVPLNADAQEISGSDLCYQYTPQMVEDTFRYLDEIYVQKYPQMALRWLQGTEEDRKVLQKLSDMITEGCTTDLQKAKAVAGWINRNIEYKINSPNFYAIQTFYDRKGSCVSYAQLMQTLLRLAGVPAVWGDGFRMDAKSITVDQMHALSEGHAWCYVLAEGEWYLFDPLWEGDAAISDKTYIAEHYFLDKVDIITPVYDMDSLPPFRSKNNAYLYADGRFRHWDHGDFEHDVGSSHLIMNGGAAFDLMNVTYRDGAVYYDYTYYIDDPERTETMLAGEFYTNGWCRRYTEMLSQNRLISFETFFYSYENGLKPNGIVMEYNGSRYFMHQGSAHRFVMNEGDYYIDGSALCVEPDFTGMIIEPDFMIKYKDDPLFYFEWSSSDASIATVDENGVVTATGKEGYTSIGVEMCWADEKRACDSESLFVYFYADDRVADYTDYVHVCSFERIVTLEPTCTETGTAVMQCICGHENSRETIPAKGHDWDEWAVVFPAVNGVSGLKVRGCMNCTYTEEQVIPSETAEQPPTTAPVIYPTEMIPPTTSVPVTEKAETIPPTNPPETQPPMPTTQPTEPTYPTAAPTESMGETQETVPSSGAAGTEQIPDGSAPESEDFLDPEKNDMVTAFVSPDGFILSVPRHELDLYTGFELSIEHMSGEGSDLAAQLIEDAIGLQENCIIYDIAMIAPDGTEIQPNDYVFISIPIPSDWDAKEVRVYFVHPEGGYVEETICSVSDDGKYARFVAEHFSCYAITQPAKEPIPTDVPVEIPAPDPGNGWIWMVIGILVFLVVAVTLVIVIYRKKKS